MRHTATERVASIRGTSTPRCARRKPITHAQLLYPYANTVFPRGLPAPTLMWNGAADAAYVQMRYLNQDNVNYQFAVGPHDPGELTVPQEAWKKIENRSVRTPLVVTLTVKSGGALSTCETQWTVAEGTLTGSLYYNTYNAPGAMFANNGAVMRLKLGEAQSEIYLQDPTVKNPTPSTGPCVSCHSVSFDGSTMVAAFHSYPGPLFNPTPEFHVNRYDVTPDVQPTAGTSLHNANFAALYPDGTRLLKMGSPQCTGGAETFPRAPNNMPFVEGPSVAQVVDTATGNVLPATGLEATHYMWMPQFSPDGTKVVFNHAKPAGTGTDRRELAIMDYDYATNTFSNLRSIMKNEGPAPSLPYAPGGTGAGFIPAGEAGCMTPAGQELAGLNPGSCTGPCYPGWPFFTPDGRGVVFQLTNEPDFASAFPGRDTSAKAELWYADIATGRRVRLDKANQGPGPDDALTNYYPTVLPVAVGGYFWVFWTSKRDYGHRMFAEPTLSGAPTTIFAELDAARKRIWVTALRPLPHDDEFATGALLDPSSPPLFLTGQSESGNVRAFTTLNPCLPAGDTCTSGLDCCTGFCFIPEDQGGNEFDITPVGHCTEEPPACSKSNERCFEDADCCPPGPNEPTNTCIGGYCTYLVVLE